MDSFNLSMDSIEKKFELDIFRINRDVIFEFGMAEVEGCIPEYMTVYYEEAGNSGERKPNIVTRIITAIKKFLHDVGTTISDLFKKDDDVVDIENFLRSQSGTVQLSYDVNAIKEGVDNEILKGRKIIQMISKGTSVPDKVVAEYVDGASNFISKYSKTAGKLVSFVALSKIRKTVSENVFKGWEQKVDEMQSVNTGAVFSKFSMSQASVDAETDPDYQQYLKDEAKRIKKAAKRMSKVASKEEAAKKMEKQKMQVLNAMSKVIHSGAGAIRTVGGEVKNVYNNTRTKIKRRDN